jgi:hypothetical protein
MSDKQIQLQEIGKSALLSIKEMVEKLEEAEDQDAIEAARQEIEEDPLSVEVRGGWHLPGEGNDSAPEEFKILLSTGGPATRIIGDLDASREPTNVKLQSQDWFTQWTDWHYGQVEDPHSRIVEILQKYASCFWYGE